MKEVVIVSAVRTPIGSFGGKLSTVPATKLGATSIKAAISKAGIKPELIDEVFMGNVIQAGVGQAPARQAAIYAGINNNVPATTVNKVCASGMKAISLGAQTILAGDNNLVVVGGMENMSMVPHYANIRDGYKLGDAKMIDGLVKDGLTDVYDKQHMGTCGDLCATEYGFTREDQDNFAIDSYKKSANAWANGNFNDEIVPVEIPQRKGDPIIFSEDEEYKNVILEKSSFADGCGK